MQYASLLGSVGLLMAVCIMQPLTANDGSLCALDWVDTEEALTCTVNLSSGIDFPTEYQTYAHFEGQGILLECLPREGAELVSDKKVPLEILRLMVRIENVEDTETLWYEVYSEAVHRGIGSKGKWVRQTIRDYNHEEFSSPPLSPTEVPTLVIDPENPSQATLLFKHAPQQD